MLISRDNINELLNKLRRDDHYWTSNLLDYHDDVTIEQLLIGSIAYYVIGMNLQFHITDERDDTHNILVYKKNENGGSFITGATGDLIWCINEVLSEISKQEIELVAEQL